MALYWLVAPAAPVVALVLPLAVPLLPTVVDVEFLEDDELHAARTIDPAAIRAKARELFFMDFSPLRDYLFVVLRMLR